MQLTVGNIQLSIGRTPLQRAADSAPAKVAAPLMLLPSQQGPWLSNALEDNPRTNISFIRETVAACMHARSEAVSRGIFRVQLRSVPRGSTSQFPLPPLPEAPPNEPGSHPVERLLAQPNPLLDLCDMLELSQQWLDATGNALWLKVRNGYGETVELWPLPSLSFYIEKGIDGLPALYRFPQTNASVPAEDLIHVRRADIRTAPFLGHAVLSDILQTAKADTAVRLYQARFFENDAMPRAVLKWPPGSVLTQQQMDEIRNAWEDKYATPANAGRLGILPDGGEVQVLGQSARELDFGRSKKELRDSIREAFKVPQIVLGDVESVNLSNAETSYTVFLRDVVDFSLAKHARALTRGLAAELGPEYTIEHVSVVPENESTFLARLRELKDALTVEEKRQLLGF